jgi:hypothetical protein
MAHREIAVKTMRQNIVLVMRIVGESVRAMLKVESSGFELVFSWGVLPQCYIAYASDSNALWIGSAAFELPAESCKALEEQLGLRSVYSNLRRAINVTRD